MTRILVIDDDKAMTDLLKMILEPECFEVYAAHSSQEGIEAIHSCNPDVIILDLVMPDSDGWDVCRAVRRASQSPILVLSALNKPELFTHALNEGADDFLSKPVQNGVLRAHIKNLIRRASAEMKATAAKNGS